MQVSNITEYVHYKLIIFSTFSIINGWQSPRYALFLVVDIEDNFSAATA